MAADLLAFRDPEMSMREYVKAYVEYVHYVERLYESTVTAAHGHFETERHWQNVTREALRRFCRGASAE